MKLHCKVNAGIIKNMINAMKLISEECVLQVDEKEIRCIAIDPSHVMMCHLRIDAGSCESYNCTKAGDVGIYVDDTAKIIKRFNDKDTVQLDVLEKEIHIKTGKKTFRVKTLNDPYNNAKKMPDIKYNCWVKINRGIIRDALQDLVATSTDSVRLTPKTNKDGIKLLVVSGTSDSGYVEIVLSESDLIPIKYDQFESVERAMYALDYVKEIFDVVNYDNMKVGFGHNSPINIQSANGLVEFMISPRVSD